MDLEERGQMSKEKLQMYFKLVEEFKIWQSLANKVMLEIEEAEADLEDLLHCKHHYRFRHFSNIPKKFRILQKEENKAALDATRFTIGIISKLGHYKGKEVFFQVDMSEILQDKNPTVKFTPSDSSEDFKSPRMSKEGFLLIEGKFKSYFKMSHLLATLIKIVWHGVSVEKWAPQFHWRFPLKIRQQILVLLKMRNRKLNSSGKQNPLSLLPKFVLFQVINFMIWLEPQAYYFEWCTALL